MGMSKKSKEAIKQKYYDLITHFLTEQGEDVLQIKGNEFCFPICDEEGNEEYIKIVVSIPTGKRNPDKTVEPFDGYNEAEGYRIEQKMKKEKAAEIAKKKAEKIRKDEAYRAKKAEQKKQREEA